MSPFYRDASAPEGAAQSRLKWPAQVLTSPTYWAEGNATVGVLSPWTWAWRLGRLLDIFHIKITHLLVKSKLRYFCYDTIVLMYYLVLHCVSSCLVLGRECNDLQVYPHLRNVRGICQPIAHHIVVFKPLCCSDCQSDLGWQLQDTGTR